MYDTYAREYMPVQGRWPSVDPAHSKWNGYAYAENPLLFSDTSGLEDGDGGDGSAGDGGVTDPTVSATTVDQSLINQALSGDTTGTGTAPCAADTCITVTATPPDPVATVPAVVDGVVAGSNGGCAYSACVTATMPDPVATLAANNAITTTFRLITKSDFCRGGDRTIQYQLVNTSTGGVPSSNWWVTEHIQAPVPTNSGGTNETPNQYLDWLSNGGTPYNALQSFTVSQGSGAPSYPVYVNIGGQDYGTLGLWMSNNPLRNGQPSPNSVNCPPQ